MLRLKQLRTGKKLYQKDVADHIGVDRTTYAKYESGASEPTLDIIVQLARFFNVDVSDILGIEKAAPAQEGDQITELQSLCSQLTPENQEKAASYLRYLLEREQPDTPGPQHAPQG